MHEEEPRRRAWGAIASVVLAPRAGLRRVPVEPGRDPRRGGGAQVNGLRTEAETQRLRAEDAQRQVDVIQKRLAAISAEKDSLAERIVSLEKAAGVEARGGEGREAGEAEESTTKATAAAPAPVRPKATPVATRNPTSKKTP